MAQSKIVSLADVVHLSRRPLPDSPDGRYDWQVAPATEDATPNTDSILHKAVDAVSFRIKHPLLKDLGLIPGILDAVRHKNAVDDRKRLFTQALGTLGQLRKGKVQQQLNDQVITILYETLPHPPATYIGTDLPHHQHTSEPILSPVSASSLGGSLGSETTIKLHGLPNTSDPTATWGRNSAHSQASTDTTMSSASTSMFPNSITSTPPTTAPATPTTSKFIPSTADAKKARAPWAFRSADGSGNNRLMPNLGKAGTSYARSVQSRHPIPANVLPDPGLVFDALLRARKEDFVPHPNGNSALTFAYASLVTHQIFRTDPRDMTKNVTSSYLDLSILYGYNQEKQDMVRDKSQGKGLLYPDAFSEDRLMFGPAASSALLVVFSRNHNYIADMILKINEKGRWSNPPPEGKADREQQDEEIFQVARLINCGHFMATIFGDYVAGFLGQTRDGSSWAMDPFNPIKGEDGVKLPRGEGNHCSVEFNLLYRWHSTTAQPDIQSTTTLLTSVFDSKPLNELELKDFVPAVARSWSHVEPNPKLREFGGIRRGADGKFNDDDLARILQDATEAPAGAYRARGTPECLRIVEMLAIQQGRDWGVCTMNEFREFLGLKRFARFEDWNSDPEIAKAARQLYGHIDNLELYPGLQAEECIPVGSGSGICCGYTMTRAILSDAIALVRGDRFYTTDYTPSNLTTWGFQDCARDPNNGALGAALPKLLLRHLPRHYTSNNIYGLFPFFTPTKTIENLKNLDILDQYDYEKRPLIQPVPKVVDTMTGIKYVFDRPEIYNTACMKDMKLLTNDYGFILVFDQRAKHDSDREWAVGSLEVWGDRASFSEYVSWYKQSAISLLKEYSYTISGVPGKRVDIVRNVINLVSVHWAAEWLMGIPLKTRKNPRGLLTEQELYDILSLLFTTVFINVQPEHGWFLESNAKKYAGSIHDLIEKSINEAAPKTASNPLVGLVSAVSGAFGSAKPCSPFLKRLAASGRPMRELTSQVIGFSVGSSVNYAQAAVHVVDFYMDEERKPERAKIEELIKKEDPESKKLLLGYVREAMRLNPQFAGLIRLATKADTIPLGEGREPVQVVAGDIIFSSYKNAQKNPVDFPDPLTINPNRPKESYRNAGSGFHICPGIDLYEQTIPDLLRVIFSLPNLRRAPGQAGKLAGFIMDQLGTDNKMYLTDTGNISPWPGSMTFIYDEED